MKETPKALEVVSSMKFNKEDIAAIAIAEAEKRMRTTIKTLQAAIIVDGKEVDRLDKEIKTIGVAEIKNKTAKLMKNIQAGLKLMKVKNLVVDLSHEIFSRDTSQDTLLLG